MNLKRIKTFIMAVEHKNFSHVADLLNISQPAVSKQIKALEEDLGTPLLYRDTLEPTEAGRIVLSQGRKLLHLWQDIYDQCQALGDQLTGVIKIGASTIPGTYLLPPVLQRFWEQFPHVEVRVSIHESEQILNMVLQDQLDLGLIGSEPVQHEALNWHIIARDKLVLIGPKDAQNISCFEEVKDEPFIFRSDWSGTWQAAEKGLNHWGYSLKDLKSVAKVEHTESVIAMVEAGLGYSFVSDLAARKALESGRIKVLGQLPLDRNFYAVYQRSKAKNKVLTHMLHFVSVNLNQRADEE
jgi:DNA-binding transcriptional LysR family regulator